MKPQQDLTWRSLDALSVDAHTCCMQEPFIEAELHEEDEADTTWNVRLTCLPRPGDTIILQTLAKQGRDWVYRDYQVTGVMHRIKQINEEDSQDAGKTHTVTVFVKLEPPR